MVWDEFYLGFLDSLGIDEKNLFNVGYYVILLFFVIGGFRDMCCRYLNLMVLV